MTTFVRRYCICKTEWGNSDPKADEYLACDNRECTFAMWYHTSCIREASKRKNSEFRKPPASSKAVWYCTVKCERECADKKLMHTKALMFAGLNLEGFKLGIRYNDAMLMKAFHKFHMIGLVNFNHKMYIRIYHRILALLEVAPAHVVHDLLHNSTVNYKGYPGGNLEMDFVNEVMNKIYKG